MRLATTAFSLLLLACLPRLAAAQGAPAFDERYYITAYADVRAAVARGTFTSGLDHYDRYGKAEGRSPNAETIPRAAAAPEDKALPFDESYYLATYPDVAGAVKAGLFASGYEHYKGYGARERRNPNAHFDERYYLATYSDVEQAVAKGTFLSGWRHYDHYGALEGRSPGPGGAVAPPAPAPPPAPGAASVWQKAGVWCVTAANFSTDFHGGLATSDHFSWVLVQVHDGLNLVNDAELRAGWIDRLRAKGISVGAWGVQRTDPENEANLAAQLVQKWGFDFYVADAEAEYKYTSPSGAPDPVAYGRSARFVKAFRAAAPKVTAALSTYGRADLCDIDWQAWRDGDFSYLPQTYWNEFAIYEPSLCVDAAVKQGWRRDRVFPTIGIWGGGQRAVVPAADYVMDLKAAGQVGFSVYVGEQMAQGEWNVLGQAITAGLAVP